MENVLVVVGLVEHSCQGMGNIAAGYQSEHGSDAFVIIIMHTSILLKLSGINLEQ